jgi:hypothetical protein
MPPPALADLEHFLALLGLDHIEQTIRHPHQLTAVP